MTMLMLTTYSIWWVYNVGLWICKAIVLVQHNGLDLWQLLLTLTSKGVSQGIWEIAKLGDGRMGQA